MTRRRIGYMLASMGLVISAVACRFAGTAADGDVGKSLDSTEGSSTTRENYRQIGVPQVTLMAAPCGSSPEVELFLSRARKLGLVNRFAKLPATEWQVRGADGRAVNLCRFLRNIQADVAYFFMITASCQECADQFGRLVADLAEKAKGPGSERFAVVAIVVGTEPAAGLESIQETTGSAELLVSMASDPSGSLWSLLTRTSGIQPPDQPAPEIIMHRSGYGVFSNTAGEKRDAMSADFLKMFAAF